MVFDEDPVAPVGAVAVDRQRLALQRVQRDQRDQLLRKLPGAVVVRGVARRGWAARRCGTRRAPDGPTPPCSPNRGCADRSAWSRRTADRPARERRTPRRWRRDGSERWRGGRAQRVCAISTLSPEHQVVIALRYYRDLPLDEIAARPGRAVRDRSVASPLCPQEAPRRHWRRGGERMNDELLKRACGAGIAPRSTPIPSRQPACAHR